MKRKSQESFIERAYDNIHAALWAALMAFVLWFAVVIGPGLPGIWARAELHRARAASGDLSLFCQKLGMGPGSPGYSRCSMSLEQYRARIRSRIADDDEAF